MKRFLMLSAGIWLAACSMDPPVPAVPLPVPASWPAGDPYLVQTEIALPELSYRDAFTDPRLQTLISQAHANNRDLQIAAANIEAARAQVRVTRANQLPEVVATGGLGISGDGDGNRQTSVDVGLGLPAFEIDLFGRLASLTRADQQRYLATESAARSVRLALNADIARGWAAYAADASLLAIAQRTVANAERSVSLTEARLKGGIVPKTDVLQARQILETAKSDLARQRTALAQDRNLLQLLVGAPIADSSLPASIAEIAPTFRAPSAGLDSRILLRRPDILQSEYQLRAANAQIGAARAALFPTISLTSLLGLASDALGNLFTGGAFSWSAAADTRYSIFNAGAGRARVRVSEAERNAAIAVYEKSIQTAFREVADALAIRGTIVEQLRSAGAQVSATAETATLVDARYREGIDPFLTSLDAQRSFYNAQKSFVQVQLEELRNVATLYQVIGGS